MTKLETYQPIALATVVYVGRDREPQYGARVGGCGGRIIGRDLLLDRDRAALLCELLESAREAGREEAFQ